MGVEGSRWPLHGRREPLAKVSGQTNLDRWEKGTFLHVLLNAMITTGPMPGSIAHQTAGRYGLQLMD